MRLCSDREFDSPSPPPILMLDELALRYGTDKASTHHNYTPTYEELFEPLREKEITLLELGVYLGASLRMWIDYFPKAKIWGVDKLMTRIPEDLRNKTIYLGLHTNLEASRELIEKRVIPKTGPLDIVIDDAKHQWNFQYANFHNLWPHVKPGGYYIVEDAQMRAYKDRRRSDPSILGYFSVDGVDMLYGWGEEYTSGKIKNKLNIRSITFTPGLIVIRKAGVAQG